MYRFDQVVFMAQTLRIRDDDQFQKLDNALLVYVSWESRFSTMALMMPGSASDIIIEIQIILGSVTRHTLLDIMEKWSVHGVAMS